MKTQPFCCDMRSGTTDELVAFIPLFKKASGHHDIITDCFWGFDIYNRYWWLSDEKLALTLFTRILPLSEGIAILKKMVGEENAKIDEPEYVPLELYSQENPLLSALEESVKLIKRTTEFEVLDNYKKAVLEIEEFITVLKVDNFRSSASYLEQSGVFVKGLIYQHEQHLKIQRGTHLPGWAVKMCKDWIDKVQKLLDSLQPKP